jgi:hypothetical protein
LQWLRKPIPAETILAKAVQCPLQAASLCSTAADKDRLLLWGVKLQSSRPKRQKNAILTRIDEVPSSKAFAGPQFDSPCWMISPEIWPLLLMMGDV